MAVSAKVVNEWIITGVDKQVNTGYHLTQLLLIWYFMILHHRLTDKDDITMWLTIHCVTDYTIRPDGIVDTRGGVKLPNFTATFGVQFGNIHGSFSCNNTNVTSLEGAPQSVVVDFYCYDTIIDSLEHAPRIVGGHFDCAGAYIDSLRGIHKTHRNWRVGGMLVIPKHTTNILGLALIPGIPCVKLGDSGRLFDISHDDPIQFQDELIDAGFTQQARM